MSEHVNPHRKPATSWDELAENVRHDIARNLAIDPARIRYFDPGYQSEMGVTGNRWQIYYRDSWQDLPWHFNGPLCVTREMVRAKLGVAEKTSEAPDDGQAGGNP